MSKRTFYFETKGVIGYEGKKQIAHEIDLPLISLGFMHPPQLKLWFQKLLTLMHCLW